MDSVRRVNAVQIHGEGGPREANHGHVNVIVRVADVFLAAVFEETSGFG